MQFKKIIIPLILISFLISCDSYSQCSDAGICSIGGPDDPENKSTKPLLLFLSYGIGFSGDPEKITYNSITTGLSYTTQNNFSFGAFIPFNINTSSLANVSGIGDLIVSTGYSFPAANNANFKLSLAGKFATGKTDKDSLPLAYQTGHGTNDILIAATYEQRYFFIGAGFQNPFGEANTGNYILKRAPDVMVRGGYNFKYENISIGIESIFIKRIKKSEVRFLSSVTSEFEEVEHSDFTQANIMLRGSMFFNEYISLDLNTAFGLLERKENIDGSKRPFSFSLGLNYTP
jgi:hypothetical protein